MAILQFVEDTVSLTYVFWVGITISVGIQLYLLINDLEMYLTNYIKVSAWVQNYQYIQTFQVPLTDLLTAVKDLKQQVVQSQTPQKLTHVQYTLSELRLKIPILPPKPIYFHPNHRKLWKTISKQIQTIQQISVDITSLIRERQNELIQQRLSEKKEASWKDSKSQLSKCERFVLNNERIFQDFLAKINRTDSTTELKQLKTKVKSFSGTIPALPKRITIKASQLDRYDQLRKRHATQVGYIKDLLIKIEDKLFMATIEEEIRDIEKIL